MARSTDPKAIYAAGAVVLRDSAAGPEVALVYRDRYQDWTLPKGKLDPGELACQAAVREVREETGLTIRLGLPLNRVQYELSRGDHKVVDYWIGHVVAESPRPPDAEISAVRWLPVTIALHRLSYPHDQDVLRQALTAPPTTPLVVLRHAKATKRSDWADGEETRPITAYGKRQASRLRCLLAAYGVGWVGTSPWLRCIATVAPYAQQLGLGIHHLPEITEAAARKNPRRHLKTWTAIRDRVVATEVPAVVCGHRPALPAALELFGLYATKVRTAEAVIVHLDPDGNTIAQEWFRL